MYQDSRYFLKPGIHSHNIDRLSSAPEPARSGVRRFRVILLLVGLTCLGYCIYNWADQTVYQAYGNWAFDQQIAGRRVSFSDYVREQTPFGFLAGPRDNSHSPNSDKVANTRSNNEQPPPTEGAVIGRVEIGRLGLSAMVRQGVDANILREAVGHVPSTALAGENGNFAIAAHRDTLFRALKDIQQGDLVTFQSPKGMYSYQVAATKIVMPTDVSVLRPDGGGIIPAQDGKTPTKLLTMITCYPFYYVGSAPKRFVVEARLISNSEYPNQAAQTSSKPML